MDQFILSEDELKLLQQYEIEEQQIVETYPLNHRALLELRVKYHAALVAPHYSEFFGQFYIAIANGKRGGFKPRNIIDLAIPQLAIRGTLDDSLAHIMLVNPEEGYPNYYIEAAQELSLLPEYKKRDLPYGLHQYDTAELMEIRGKRSY